VKRRIFARVKMDGVLDHAVLKVPDLLVHKRLSHGRRPGPVVRIRDLPFVVVGRDGAGAHNTISPTSSSRSDRRRCRPSPTSARCGNGQHVDEVDLLRDVAVAFKHHRPRNGRITASSDIAPGAGGFSQCRYGEGKYGGVEQIVVATNTGDKRALSSVLQDVFDAWMTVLGQPLPPISRY
jgi:hypothetical protein